MRQLKIKICGLKSPDNIIELSELDAHMHGFIFYKGSPRCAPEEPLPVFSGIRRCGVFVDAPVSEVKERVERFQLDAVQLCGREDAPYLEMVRTALPRIQILIALDPGQSETKYLKASGLVDFYVFDNHSKGRGGSGVKFNWKSLEKYEGDIPYFLSGGIGPADAAIIKAMAANDSRMQGVDLNSKFEFSPGVKSKELLSRFFAELNI